MGDFNANILLDRGLAEDMNTIGLHLINNSIPTHYTSSTSTLIDLSFVDNSNRILLFDLSCLIFLETWSYLLAI